MKFSTFGSVALVCLLSTSAFAKQYEGQLNVIDGDCRYETTKEIIKIQNLPAHIHYGKFAEGTSSRKDWIYLTQNSMNSVLIYVTTKDSESASAAFALNPNGPTAVDLGLVVNSKSKRPEWLSCSLEVKAAR